MKKSVLTLAVLGLVVSLAGCSFGGSTNDDASNNTGAEVEVNQETVVETATEEVVAEEVNVDDAAATGDIAEEVNVDDAVE